MKWSSCHYVLDLCFRCITKFSVFNGQSLSQFTTRANKTKVQSFIQPQDFKFWTCFGGSDIYYHFLTYVCGVKFHIDIGDARIKLFIQLVLNCLGQYLSFLINPKLWIWCCKQFRILFLELALYWFLIPIKSDYTFVFYKKHFFKKMSLRKPKSLRKC